MGRLTRFPRGGPAAARLALAAGAACLAPTVLGAALGLLGWLPHDPTAFVAPAHAPPGPDLWLGADALGRDLAARLASAAARFAGPALLAVAVGALVGVALGLAEGLLPGPVAALATGLAQAVDGVPKLVTVLLVAAVTQSDLGWIMAAVGVSFAPQVAEPIRSSIERLRSLAFIEAARSLGVGPGRIVFVHILWGHARRVLLAQATSLLSFAVLAEASLSYLGGELGVQEPAASWGNMLALARDGVFRGHWLPALAPAVMLSLTLLGLNLLGRGLLEAVEEPR
ncbi:ABC transporter permease [Deferrisoma camini]|uniref:ABC transporter permease n=1 Tax=Deferrisoma camini TaxID=1035120 RepID=UPI00046D1C9D|nr:ABC transporter permease [Deferrisoma camini]